MMDTSKHDIQTLFLQLGLPNQPEEIEGFIQVHKLLENGISLDKAQFWTESQAAFLREAISEDSDWCELVDELDTCLRQ